jgi:hypothetical protein
MLINIPPHVKCGFCQSNRYLYNMSNYKSYFYKSMGLREDQLPELQGGKGEGMDQTQVDPEQLQMGIKVEMEHTNDQELAKEIAMDHLAEDPQYYAHLKAAGMADELPNGQQPPNQPPMQMQKLMSPSAKGPSIIGVAVRGTKTGLLPAGGVVADPEKCARGGLEKMNITPPGTKDASDRARLGGLEPVKNPKSNSQGAFANTPTSDVLKVDAGHFTPDNKSITQGEAPQTSKKGGDEPHPMQVQQLGNPPPTDDGTGHDGTGLKPAGEKKVEPHPMSGPIAGPEGGSGAEKDLSKSGIDEPESDNDGEEEEKPTKGPWGIDLDDEDEDDEEGKDVSVDIKETLKEAKKGVVEEETPSGECGLCGGSHPTSACPEKKVGDSSSMKDRFQKLANIKTEGWAQGEYTPQQEQSIALLTKKGFREVSTFAGEPDAEGGNMGSTVTVVLQKKQGPVRLSCEVDPDGSCNGQPVQQFLATQVREELQELVGRLNAKGTVTPLLQKAQAYLVKSKSK